MTDVSAANSPWDSFPAVAHTRTRVPSSAVRSTHLMSPTMKASRYVDITGVSENRTRLRPPSTADSSAIIVFETACKSSGTTSVTSNVAFIDGSSQHGKARRASVASNCVVARCRSSPFTSVYRLR